MRAAVADRRGSAVVVALMVCLLFLAAGLAIMSTVDTQQRASGRERVGESSFGLAESALSAQLQRLVARWPTPGTAAYPLACPPGATNPDCPSTAGLRSVSTGPDHADTAQSVWTTSVRDDGAAPGDQYWTEDMLATRPTFDADGDGRVWLRAQAVVRGRPRTLVALVARPPAIPGLPENMTLLAGSFATSNNGNKEIVLNTGSGEVVVRCGAGTMAAPSTAPSTGCAEYEKGAKLQVSPERVSSQRDFPAVMTPERIAQARDQALREGNLVPSCTGAVAMVPGELVLIESAGSACTLTGSGAAAQPGVVVVLRGKVTTGGNQVLHGLIMHANLDSISAALVEIGGTAAVVGGILVDGQGGVLVGSSKDNLIFDPLGGQAFRPLGMATLVQGSFREIVAG